MPYNLQNNSRLPLPDMNQLACNRMTEINYKDIFLAFSCLFSDKVTFEHDLGNFLYNYI